MSAEATVELMRDLNDWVKQVRGKVPEDDEIFFVARVAEYTESVSMHWQGAEVPVYDSEDGGEIRLSECKATVVAFFDRAAGIARVLAAPPCADCRGPGVVDGTLCDVCREVRRVLG